MITLTAKINLLSGDNSKLQLGSDNLSGNNISRDLSRVVGVKMDGSNPFIIGASKLGDGSTFSGQTIVNAKEEKVIKTTSITATSEGYSIYSFSYTTDLVRDIKIESIKSNGQVVATSHINSSTVNYSSGAIRGAVYIYDAFVDLYDYLEITVSYNIPYKFKGLNYFIGDQLSDENGNFASQYEITINATENLTSFTISFDTINNRHPNSIYIDGKEYIDDDPIFTATNLEPANSHTIIISNWNSPPFPLVITGIYAEVSIEVDYRNLISISRSIFDRSDLRLPSWGIISNTGNIEFNDTNGEIRDYAEQLLLESGLKCEIFLNNTLAKSQERIGLFETDEWDYDNDNRVVSVSLKDDLEEWQDINVAEINYDPRKIESKPFKWLYEHLWELTTENRNYNMLSFDELDTDTQGILQNTYTQYPLLESGSLWVQWTKLCEVCQLHIYKNNDGIVVCRYNGGN